jgi:hypothetical protein
MSTETLEGALYGRASLFLAIEYVAIRKSESKYDLRGACRHRNIRTQAILTIIVMADIAIDPAA